MDWLDKLAEARGKQISEYKADTIARWVESFVDGNGRLPDKGELLAEVERLCELNLWNRDLVTKLRSYVFGEKVERPPSNPVERLRVRVKKEDPKEVPKEGKPTPRTKST